MNNGGILTKMTGKFPAFEDRAKEALRNVGFPVRNITAWINTHWPTREVGYESGYPHSHKNNDGLVLIHYLLAGDKPAPLDVFDGSGALEERIYPEPGLTLYMPDGVSHAAHRNNGTTPRVCFVVMGHR